MTWNKMPFDFEKNVDKADKEIRKEKSNPKIVFNEVHKAYKKAVANGLICGTVIGFAALGVIAVVNSVRNTNDEE